MDTLVKLAWSPNSVLPLLVLWENNLYPLCKHEKPLILTPGIEVWKAIVHLIRMVTHRYFRVNLSTGIQRRYTREKSKATHYYCWLFTGENAKWNVQNMKHVVFFFFFCQLKCKTGEFSIVALLTKTMYMASGPRLVKSRLKTPWSLGLCSCWNPCLEGL